MHEDSTKNTRGFTLIELLVVIAIIALLSSVVLASLNTARARANTSTIKSQVLQFRTLMELEFAATGSYTNLNRGYWHTNNTCANRGFTGAHATKAVEICERLLSVIVPAASIYELSIGVDPNAPYSLSNADQYSIMAILPNGEMFCVGSSGAVTTAPFTSAGYLAKGCYRNP